MPEQVRVISYVDGFNLYFGLRSKGWRRYYWLDLVALSRSLLKPGQYLVHTHYFTARIQHRERGQSAGRQAIWLDALAAQEGITCHFGHYLAKQRRCHHCGAVWTSYEEKMTDVRIATQLIVDAYEDRFDTAIIISGDSDLAPPIEAIRNSFRDKRIIIAFPPGRRSERLKSLAHGYLVIGKDKLRKSLLPDQVVSPSGRMIHRPKEWR